MKVRLKLPIIRRLLRRNRRPPKRALDHRQRGGIRAQSRVGKERGVALEIPTHQHPNSSAKTALLLRNPSPVVDL